MRERLVPPVFLMIGLSASMSAQLHDLPLSKDGIGPVLVSASVTTKGRVASLSASAQNGSQYTIDHLWLCVRGNGQKTAACAFTLWLINPLASGEKQDWSIDGPKQRGIETPVISIMTIKAFNPALAATRRLFIAEIEGNSGAMAREQAVATLSNTNGRFEITEERSTADAIITGRSESREGATIVNTTGNTSGVSGAAVIAGTLLTGGNANASGTAVKEVHVNENLVLKLALPKGQIVWAWDDSKPCNDAKVRCAIADLVSVTR